ncbi:MAG TPA: IclR family transcriptional regulator [Steroidobacteraceae bacterium]|nr:IclR family transcriptional regulator [Steroidobacteraceae bacterium]
MSRVSATAQARSAKTAQSDGRRQSVRAVAIGASLLSTLGKFGGDATLSELAAAAHLPLSKAHRYLRALIGSAFVEQDAATGNYRLGSEALALGLAALAGIDLVALATPLIAALSALVNETIVLSIWANHGATVVHVKEPPRRVTVVTRIGSVLPLLTSATGLVFAAYLPAEEIEAMKSAEIDALAHGRSTARQAAAVLDKRLRAVRTNGVAAVQSLFFPGIDAIAAPAFAANGRIAAVITVLGPTTSFDASTDGRIARAVTSTAALLSSRLGYTGR